MERRDFLKLMSYAGASSLLPFGLNINTVRAAYPHSGLLVMNVHANGAWDTSSFCDPKQRTDVNNWANNDNSRVAGNLRYAPFANNAAFFNKYYQDMLVINGVHGHTNAHPAGRRHQVTGKLATGFPTSEGLYSAVVGQDLPLAYLGQGPVTETAGGIVKYTRASANRIKDVSLPNKRGNGNYFSQTALDLVRQAQLQRAQDLLQQNHLPKTKEKIAELRNSQANTSVLENFGNNLPASFDNKDLTGKTNYMITHADVALHAMREGVCCSAAVQSFGFDTHSDHDARQAVALTDFTNLVDYIWTRAGQLGIANRLLVVLTSDFARTPKYNGGNGKDHWAVGSAVLMKKNVGWTNRVVGCTTGTQDALKINPSTLQEDANGVELEPKHVHSLVRQLAGITNTELAMNQFALGAENVSFLNQNRSTGFPHLS